jgi:hypothetical protein
MAHTSGASQQDLQQLRDELSAALRRADNAELMLLTTSDILRRCSRRLMSCSALLHPDAFVWAATCAASRT